jgi:SHS family sialic acid transporter-like MFS transporter
MADQNNGQYAATAVPPPAIEATRITRAQWLVLAAAVLGWMFDGVEIGLPPIMGRPAMQDLLGPEMARHENIAPLLGVLGAMFLVGAAAGGVLFGWLGDRFGRVRIMIFSVLTYSLFTGAAYWAQVPWQLMVLRFIASMGMGGQWSLGVALVVESWPGIARPVLAGVIGAAANVGFLLISTLGYLIPVTPDSWRWIMVAGASPAVLVFFIALFVPESERWKAAVRKRTVSPIQEIFSPALRSKTFIAIALSAIPLLGTWGSVQWVPYWVDKTLAPDDPSAKSLAQIYSSVGAIIGCLIAPVLGGRWGRRPVYFGMCAISLGTCLYMFLVLKSFDWWFLATLTVTGGITASFYGWLPLYLPELFPTRARATGQGLSFNFGRILAAVGVILGSGQIAAFFGGYEFAGAIISLVYIFGLVAIWLAPETRGQPLPE